MSESKKEKIVHLCTFSQEKYLFVYVFITALDSDDTRIATYSSSSDNTFTFNGSVQDKKPF